MKLRTRFVWWVTVCGGLAWLGGCSSDATPSDAPIATPDSPTARADSPTGGADGPAGDASVLPSVQMKTLSGRADMVSGGDALVEIVLPAGTSATGLHVTVGSTDVSSAFAVRADTRITGVITGLADGPNTVKADLAGRNGAQLVITNHKIGGPVFSGPQITPFVCATPRAMPASGDTPATNASGLSTNAVDAQCNIATEAKLFYRTTKAGCSFALPDPSPPAPAPTNDCFNPYDPSAPVPADLAMTTTDANVTVPYIVRVERGTLNRGIYDIAVLFDPSKDDPQVGWKATAPQAAWNHKVVYSFGASTGQPRRQFRSEQSWDDDSALSRGFLVADNSMTDSLYNSNRVLMSETVMMMKEKIGDSYGEIKYMISNGCSGGSLNQLTAASIYPGLIDGVQPTCTYPDSESTATEVADCALLVYFYDTPAWATLVTGLDQDQINAKKAAINGHLDQTGCHSWVNLFSNGGRPGNFVPTIVLDNTTGRTGPAPTGMTNNCQLPASMVYDAHDNPTGARCSGADNAVAIWGKASGTNRALLTNDNVGVQYGLAAFLSGAITAEDFVTLNEKIGGVDFDQNQTTTRTTADADALTIAYRAGIVSDGHHLAETPIIDLRGWDDSNLATAAFGIHHIWRSFSLRARLDGAVGGHANHVMWRYGTGLIAPPASGLTLQSFLLMDQWVGAIKADTSPASLAAKVVLAKPATAVDFCYLTSDTTFATKVTDFATCDTDPRLKRHASPRQVAGGPLSEDVLKCQLKPINRSDYAAVGLSDDQFNRLSAAFPQGVCDFSKPGVGQVPAVSPLDFSSGPGGTALPAPPTSTPL